MFAVKTTDTTLHARSVVNKPGAKTIVFINSLGTDFRIWDGVAHYLKGQFNLVFHDKRGHGLSALGTSPISIHSYADDLEQLLSSVKANRIILCGLSVGGLIAQQVMTNGRVAVEGVVLSNTGLKIGTNDMWNTRIAGIEASGVEGIADGVMERWFSPAFRSSNPAQLSVYRTMLARTPQAGYIACCKAIRDHQGFDHSARKVPPVLCIGGSLDGSTPPALVQAMAANVPGAKHVEFEGTGHLPCIEQPERYADVIAKFAEAI